MKSFIKKSFLAILASMFVLTSVFALQNFTVNPSSVTQSIDVSSSFSNVLTIENVGDENISLQITKENLISGSSTISLNLNQSSIVNLTPGGLIQIEVSYTSSTTDGVFDGLVTLTNVDNTSHFEVVNFEVTVNQPPISQDGRLEIVSPSIGEPGDGIIRMSGEPYERISLDLRFENIGDETIVITDIITTNFNARSSSDRIRTSDVDFDITSFTLQPDDREYVEFEIDIPRDIDVDLYEGDLIVQTQNHGEFIWEVEIDVYSDSEDEVYVRDNYADVRNK